MWVWLIFGVIAAAAAVFAVAPLVRPRGARLTAAIVAVAIIGAGLALYMTLGRPEMAARAFEAPETQNVNALVASLAVKMRERPNDIKGWLLLGHGYFGLGAKDEAVKALAHAVHLAKTQNLPAAQRAEILSDYAVAASQAAGAVTPDAEAALKESLVLDPKGKAARYYLGLAAAARGDAAAAERMWQSLLADTPADAPYRGEIVDRLAALRAQGPAGSAPDVQAMVAGLAARLAADPNDLDGWQRLVRAYAVLGERNKATAALATARHTFASDADALAALDRTARENTLP